MKGPKGFRILAVSGGLILAAAIAAITAIASVPAGPAAAQSKFPPLNGPPGGTQAYPGQNTPPQVYPGQGGDNPQLHARLNAMMAKERQDFGVQPTRSLHAGAMHGPTPNKIPGGRVVTTKGLFGLVKGAGEPYAVFDVLGSGETLPGALNAVAASRPGTFQDRTQQQFGQFLSQVTRGNRNMALTFYCLNPQCWMSYNAALRAINLGYRNVLWYRGGIEAWKHAGLPTQRAGGPMMHGQGQPPYRR